MTATAERLVGEGFQVMPHFPARSINSKAELADWITRYRDVGVEQALLIAGGRSEPRGEFDSSMQMIETGLFDKSGFTRLHVAGHPEGNKDIDPDGSQDTVMYAIGWKAEFAKRTDATVAVATQFCFESEPVIGWANRLAETGIDLPIHIGVSGPAKLQTLIKFAMISGVGPSIRVLQKRAADLTKLMLPFEPTAFLTDLANHKAENPDFLIEAVHFFPFGGISKTAEYANGFGTGAARAEA
jgi:methylenetetrahydrofolate reductase (NADH)